MTRMTSLRGAVPACASHRPGIAIRGLTAALLATLSVPLAAAEIADGARYAWAENAGWLDFKATDGEVQVYADHLEGFVWHENLGWIRLGTHTGGGSHTYGNTTKADYGVNRNSSTGALSGFAWSENVGWINFGASDGAAAIDLVSGGFTGSVWGENVGWISLSGEAENGDDYGVALAGEAGQCGGANGIASLQPPTADLCATGAAGAVTTANGTHRWTCAGIAGGADAQCSAPGSSGGGGGGGNGTVTFVATAGGCTVDSASVDAPPEGGPTGRTMPYGAVAFRLRGCATTTGDSATVRLTFSGSVDGWEYWKFVNGDWVRITTGVTLAGNTATIAIADNGPYDTNPNVGEIDDPSGPVAPRDRPAPIPALSLWGLVANVALLGLLGAWRQRRQRR